MEFQLQTNVSEKVRDALGALIRTEDIAFSPDNRRLAIADFTSNCILVIDVAIDAAATPGQATLSDCITIRSPGLQRPHGLCFIDDETLIVSNRGGEAPILKLPPADLDERTFVLRPLQTLRADQSDYLKAPGSVTTIPIGRDLYEVLICNNSANYVTRHLLDARREFRVLRSRILLATDLDNPDGIAVDAERRWIAISNHNTRNVAVFSNDPALDRRSRPAAVLGGVAYPHGLRFTPDGDHLLVADAGVPYVHVFARGSAGWDGRREPTGSIRVMDDETFRLGRYNPQEGGPKGIAVSRDGRVCVTTCEKQPVAFFDLETMLELRAPDRSRSGSNRGCVQVRATADATTELAAAVGSDLAELTREALVRELEYSADVDARMAVQKAELDAAHARRMRTIQRSRSWRMTAPLRWIHATWRNRGA